MKNKYPAHTFIYSTPKKGKIPSTFSPYSLFFYWNSENFYWRNLKNFKCCSLRRITKFALAMSIPNFENLEVRRNPQVQKVTQGEWNLEPHQKKREFQKFLCNIIFNFLFNFLGCIDYQNFWKTISHSGLQNFQNYKFLSEVLKKQKALYLSPFFQEASESFTTPSSLISL